MNELISRIALDLRIERYEGEILDDFYGRVVYSGIGLWCLELSKEENSERKGISKKGQTVKLDRVLKEYQKIYPGIKDYFVNPKARENFSTKVRQFYESVGYLRTTEENRNCLTSYDIEVDTDGYKNLYIGTNREIPLEMNGLGIFLTAGTEAINVNQFLARDNLSNEAFIESQYDVCDFEERYIDLNSLQFFNPLLKSAPSQSWGDQIETDLSIARTGLLGPYYRIIRNDEKIWFCEEQNSGSGLYAEDFRRLYFALRSYYENPQPVWVMKVDKNYSKIRLSAKLPAREYSLILLCAWPLNNAFSTQEYLIRKELLPMVIKALNSIGIMVKEF